MAKKQSGWTTVPKSRAATAYDLLDEICGLIAEEPLRYDQTDWLQHFHNDYASIEEAQEIGEDHIPACGTIGCVAGWVVELTKYPKGIVGYSFSIGELAKRRLGLNTLQTNQLFGSDVIQPRNEVGPKEHAEQGVRHIRQFMEAYETQLRAKRLEPIGKDDLR